MFETQGIPWLMQFLGLAYRAYDKGLRHEILNPKGFFWGGAMRLKHSTNPRNAILGSLVETRYLCAVPIALPEAFPAVPCALEEWYKRQGFRVSKVNYPP